MGKDLKKKRYTHTHICITNYFAVYLTLTHYKYFNLKNYLITSQQMTAETLGRNS